MTVSVAVKEIGRRERIRTSDPFVPNEVRYQAALHADMVLTVFSRYD